MSKCPYTWFKGFFSGKTSHEAQSLRVTVTRNEIVTVDVVLPAQSSRWLIDLIPEHVLAQIRNEGIPIQSIQETLKMSETLYPTLLFSLVEDNRSVNVCLE